MDSGITEEYAIQQNKIQGDNKLTEKKKKSLIIKFLHEISNGFAIMLWVGVLLCFITYGLDPEDSSNIYLGIIISFVVLLTAGITFK